MNFVEELGRSIDPEAFEADVWGNPDREEAVRLETRRREVTDRIVAGLGRLQEDFRVVRLPIRHFEGDYYQIDGYGEGRKGTLFLNEKRLGAFLMTLLSMGGSVVSIAAFDARFRNSHVMAIVKLHPDRKGDLRRRPGWRCGRRPASFPLERQRRRWLRDIVAMNVTVPATAIAAEIRIAQPTRRGGRRIK